MLQFHSSCEVGYVQKLTVFAVTVIHFLLFFYRVVWLSVITLLCWMIWSHFIAFVNLCFVCVDIQLCFARPIGECPADAVLAFTSVIDFVQNNGSNAWHNARVFGTFWHLSFYITFDFLLHGKRAMHKKLTSVICVHFCIVPVAHLTLIQKLLMENVIFKNFNLNHFALF